MNKLKLSLIILLIGAGLTKTQNATSQIRFNAAQSTVNFKFTTWNTEWLECSSNGPSDDALQLNNVVAVIKNLNSDIVALQEVNTTNAYATVDTIIHKLGAEWSGSVVTSTNYSDCNQYQAIVYKNSKVQLVSASLITDGGSSSDWSSGRYPVLYNVNLMVDGTAIPVSVINIHAKAMSDATSYSRRKSASEALKTLLDGSAYNTKRIVLLGDFNDYLTGTQCSSCSPGDSPYKNFVDDTNNYECLTTNLYDPSYNSPVIDNIIISNELANSYKQNSTSREVVATQSITNYTNTTSDHTPVSASFDITVGAATPGCNNVSYSETFAGSLGNFIPYSEVGDQVWYWRQTYGACVSGYYSNVNYANEDWLISPAFDLSNQSSATLAFSHALNFVSTQSDIINNQTLWISTNYTDGAPANATWTQLTIPNMPSGNSWTYVNSGDIQIPSELLKSNVHFAFKYISGATVAGTWEIRDLTLNSVCTSTGVPAQTAEAQSKVYVSDKKIVIENQQAEPTTVCDITGRVLFSVPSVLNTEIPVYQSGVYIVRTGNNVSKVIIK